jgi:hypothetical protein
MERLSESLNAQAERETYSENVCQGCKGYKEQGHSFCIRCYKSMPATLRRKLQDATKQTFGTAYDDAKSWLRENL